MNSKTKLLLAHPTPWRIDTMNAEGVVVLDSMGESVFEEWFGDQPDEIPTSVIESYIEDRFTFARFLIEWSENIWPRYNTPTQ